MKLLWIILISCIASFQNPCLGQATVKQFLKENLHFNIALIIDPFGLGVGAVHNVSIKVFNGKHLEGLAGLQYQHYHNFRSRFEKNISSFSPPQEKGLHLTTNWKLYPLKKKTLSISLGCFIGGNHLITKGTLDIPQYGISENFEKSFIYFNYGITPSFGWRFANNIEISLFSMLSLKGFLDKGRTRPAEIDSRFFVGLNFGFSLK